MYLVSSKLRTCAFDKHGQTSLLAHRGKKRLVCCRKVHVQNEKGAQRKLLILVSLHCKPYKITTLNSFQDHHRLGGYMYIFGTRAWMISIGGRSNCSIIIASSKSCFKSTLSPSTYFWVYFYSTYFLGSAFCFKG